MNLRGDFPLPTSPGCCFLSPSSKMQEILLQLHPPFQWQQLGCSVHLEPAWEPGRVCRAWEESWRVHVPSSQRKRREVGRRKPYFSLGLVTWKGGAGGRKSPLNTANNHNSNIYTALSVQGTVQSNLHGLLTQVILRTTQWGGTINIPILQMHRNAN